MLANVQVKSLFTKSDLQFVYPRGYALSWASNSQSPNDRIENFFMDLSVPQFDYKIFLKTLSEKSMLDVKAYPEDWEKTKQTSKTNFEKNIFMQWLSNKSNEWHQKLYAFLNDYLKGSHYFYDFSTYKHISFIKSHLIKLEIKNI